MSSGRILIADDEPSVRDSVGYALSQEGFEVTGAVDGDDAMEKIGDDGMPFDLLILDIMMPGPSGLDICRDVRARSAVPIIILTAKDAEIDKVVGLEVGADDYVTKPFSVRELLGRVRAQLRRPELDRSPLSQQSRIEAGPVSIDLARHLVTIRGRQVNLTRSEFQLLRLLAARPGEVFRRAQIMEELWQTEFDGDERACDVHISNLRQKVERDAQRPEIVVPCGASATSSTTRPSRSPSPTGRKRAPFRRFPPVGGDLGSGATRALERLAGVGRIFERFQRLLQPAVDPELAEERVEDPVAGPNSIRPNSTSTKVSPWASVAAARVGPGLGAVQVDLSQILEAVDGHGRLDPALGVAGHLGVVAALVELLPADLDHPRPPLGVASGVTDQVPDRARRCLDQRLSVGNRHALVGSILPPPGPGAHKSSISPRTTSANPITIAPM